MPLPPQPPYNPNWLNRVTGPNIQSLPFSGSGDLTVYGRQPNLTFIGATVQSDPINAQNIVAISPFGIPVYGAGGTSIILNPGISYTISSSVGADPYAQYVLGNIDGELPNALVAVGQGGTTVTPGGGQLVISSSLGQSSSYYGAGGTSVTVNGSTITVSSSLGQSSSFYGQGGTTVTVIDNSQVFVSSSIFADEYASYALVTADSELPKARTLVGDGDITLTDNGPGSTLKIGYNANAIFGTSTSSFGNVSGGSFTITTQNVLFVTTSAGPANISLPPSTLGRTIMMKDVSGVANANNFTVFPVNGNNIDQASSSYAFNINFGVLRLIGDGVSGWYTW